MRKIERNEIWNGFLMTMFCFLGLFLYFNEFMILSAISHIVALSFFFALIKLQIEKYHLIVIGYIIILLDVFWILLTAIIVIVDYFIKNWYLNFVAILIIVLTIIIKIVFVIAPTIERYDSPQYHKSILKNPFRKS